MLSACSLKVLSLLNYTVQSAFAWSSSSDGMVCGPDHGPGIYLSISVHMSISANMFEIMHGDSAWRKCMEIDSDSAAS